METIGDDAKRVILAGAARGRHKRAPAECIESSWPSRVYIAYVTLEYVWCRTKR